MKLLSSAADSISDADLFESSIRQEQQWSLMPVHGILSTIRPAHFVQGQLRGRQNFPAWLGKNSTTRKNIRLLEDVRNHMQVKTSASLNEIRLQYLPVLKHPLLHQQHFSARSLCPAIPCILLLLKTVQRTQMP